MGMRSLRGDAWLKVLHGVSTVDEVVKNAKADHNLLIKRLVASNSIVIRMTKSSEQWTSMANDNDVQIRNANDQNGACKPLA